jgi:hypothetical protein
MVSASSLFLALTAAISCLAAPVTDVAVVGSKTERDLETRATSYTSSSTGTSNGYVSSHLRLPLCLLMLHHKGWATIPSKRRDRFPLGSDEKRLTTRGVVLQLLDRWHGQGYLHKRRCRQIQHHLERQRRQLCRWKGLGNWFCSVCAPYTFECCVSSNLLLPAPSPTRAPFLLAETVICPFMAGLHRP